MSNNVTYSVAAGQPEEEEDSPVVFLCGKCSLPIGDSFSWAGSEEARNQIILNRVSENVLVGQETHFSGIRGEPACLVVHLTCQGCSSSLGMMYTSTPKKLDYKRAMFFLNVAAIESYVLGSSSQQVAQLDPEQQPVTLEYKLNVEQQLTEMKNLTVTMGQRLLEVEAELGSKHSDLTTSDCDRTP